ncbi:MAG TPA: energy transducer TonB [Pyrinomonadaceae bacterium]|nr:energy transducer TonB [Pyrinomonadaceae bacterium]
MVSFIKIALVLLLISPTVILAQNSISQKTISILDLGKSSIALKAVQKIRDRFRSSTEFLVADPDLSRAAAQGTGYSGSLNMTLTEARDLGVAMATDFYTLGDAQTLRRSSSDTPVYFESYCKLFIVSSRTGRLVYWAHERERSNSAEAAEQKLLERLSAEDVFYKIKISIRRAIEDEYQLRTTEPANTQTFEVAPDDEAAEQNGLRLPRPFTRYRPEYTEAAATAEVEATIDLLVDIKSDGEVAQVQVARWAGFGLEESAIATVRKLHFFPAQRDGKAIPLRVLLRYNFRKPSS